MKKWMFILAIFIVKIGFGQGTNNKIETRQLVAYKLSYKDDVNQKDYKESIMYLFIGESASLFMSEKRTLDESSKFTKIFHPDQYKETLPKLTLLGGSTINDFFIVKTKKEITTYENLSIVDANDMNYKYSEEHPGKWNFSEKTEMINNLKCEQATINFAGRNWIVWFSPNIPIQEGPFKFSGLPGLIVKATDDTNTWIFELMDFDNNDSVIYYDFDSAIKYEKVSKKDFFTTREYLLNNSFDYRVSAGKTKNDPDLRNKFLENRKKDNNQIERSR